MKQCGNVNSLLSFIIPAACMWLDIMLLNETQTKLHTKQSFGLFSLCFSQCWCV